MFSISITRDMPHMVRPTTSPTQVLLAYANSISLVTILAGPACSSKRGGPGGTAASSAPTYTMSTAKLMDVPAPISNVLSHWVDNMYMYVVVSDVGCRLLLLPGGGTSTTPVSLTSSPGVIFRRGSCLYAWSITPTRRYVLIPLCTK